MNAITQIGVGLAIGNFVTSIWYGYRIADLRSRLAKMEARVKPPWTV